MTKLISQLTDLEKIIEADRVMVHGAGAEEEVFLSTLRRDHFPYVFGGFATLSREQRYGKEGILERRYAFDVHGSLVPRIQEELFFEQGNARYEQLYNPILRKGGWQEA